MVKALIMTLHYKRGLPEASIDFWDDWDGGQKFR